MFKRTILAGLLPAILFTTTVLAAAGDPVFFRHAPPENVAIDEPALAKGIWYSKRERATVLCDDTVLLINDSGEPVVLIDPVFFGDSFVALQALSVSPLRTAGEREMFSALEGASLIGKYRFIDDAHSVEFMFLQDSEEIDAAVSQGTLVLEPKLDSAFGGDIRIVASDGGAVASFAMGAGPASFTEPIVLELASSVSTEIAGELVEILAKGCGGGCDEQALWSMVRSLVDSANQARNRVNPVAEFMKNRQAKTK